MKECQANINKKQCNCSYDPCSRKGICYTFTTDPSFRTGCVGTGAVYKVLFLITGAHCVTSIKVK